MLANLAAGHVLCDRYRIRRVLGKGGMGVVYEAEDTALRRQVALKLTTVRNPLAGEETDQRREERFLREASINAQIAHPNVVTIYDYGRGEVGVESFCYIAMELLAGETLGHRMRRTRAPVPTPELLPIVTQIARGLRAAHQRGLVHRDLKPDNIMLTPGEDGVEVARILDFGLAKDTKDDGEASLTDAGTVMGTPEYMAPEQVLAHDVDARTDLYALGILLFECVSGAAPFRNANPIRVASAHVCEPAPPLRTPAGSSKPSAALTDLVRKLMEKKPEDRVQTAEDTLRLLRELPESMALRVCEQGQGDSLAFTTQCRYQTGRKLAESASAVIYEATHLELGRQVALKIFRAVQSMEVARLKRELPALATFRHASNARVLDVGMTSQKTDGRPFLVMERVRGPSLRQVLAKKRIMSWRRAVDLHVGILEGLAEAHAVGVLHRHLSPEHVLVPNAGTRRETVKIIGYRVAEGGADFTGPMLLSLPDPAYTAPEVLRGSALSERTDLYAVGVMLHEAVLGRLPGTLPPQLRASQPVSAEELPPELLDAIRRAVSVDPAERFESADELSSVLIGIRTGTDRAPVSGTQETGMRISLGQQRLRSTGRPVVWVLAGDPALRKPPMTEVILGLRAGMQITEIAPDQRAALAARLREEDELPPWLVIFGGMHVVLEDPVLSALARAPEVARLLVSTHANADLLDAAINFCGIDQHVVLPSSVSRLRETIERLVVRTGASRRLYDDLRLAAQHGPSAPAQGRADRVVVSIR